MLPPDLNKSDGFRFTVEDNGLITEAEPQNEEQEPNDHVITEVTRQIRALYYGYRDNGLDFKTLENIIDKLKKEVENPQK